MLLSEFNVQRNDFWFHWTYEAITQTIYMRLERQPDKEESEPPIGSKFDLENFLPQ